MPTLIITTKEGKSLKTAVKKLKELKRTLFKVSSKLKNG